MVLSGVTGDSDTRSVLLLSGLFCNLVLNLYFSYLLLSNVRIGYKEEMLICEDIGNSLRKTVEIVSAFPTIVSLLILLYFCLQY